VHPLLAAALDADAGTDDFGESVDVVGLDSGFGFDPFAQFVGPRFGAEHPDADRQLVHVDAVGGGLFDHIVEIGGRAADCRRPEVAHQHDLALGVAARSRHHGRAQRFGSVVCAEPAGEESVAVGDLDHVLVGEAAAGEGAFHHLHPDFEVFPGVADHDRLAGGSARSVEADHLGHGNGEQPERIGVPQIGLDRKRQFREVGQCFKIVGREIALLHAAAKEGDVGISVAYDLPQTFELEFAQIVRLHVVKRAQVIVQVKRHFSLVPCWFGLSNIHPPPGKINPFGKKAATPF